MKVWPRSPTWKLKWKGEPAEFRRSLLSTAAAWAIGHPGEKASNEVIFAEHMRKLRDAVFESRRQPVAELCRDAVVYVTDGEASVPADRRKEVRGMLDGMARRFGYCDACARDAAAMLIAERFRELVG